MIWFLLLQVICHFHIVSFHKSTDSISSDINLSTTYAIKEAAFLQMFKPASVKMNFASADRFT